MSTRENDAKVERLRSHFGNSLDKETLEAVLACCEGDVSRAITFMTAGSGGYDPAKLAQPGNETSIPSDYPIQKRTASLVPNASSSSTASKTIGSGMRRLFLSAESTLREHYDAQGQKHAEYVATLLLLLHQGVEVMRSARPKVLAASWAHHDFHLADYLLKTHSESFQLPQVLSALELLDARRKTIQLQRKLASLVHEGCKKTAKLGLLRSQINDLAREEHIGSVSGALAKHVRNWVRTIPADQLAFYALALPADPWRQLADLIHLNPSTDFPEIFSGSKSTTTTASNPAPKPTTTTSTTTSDECSTKTKGKGKEKVKEPKTKHVKKEKAHATSTGNNGTTFLSVIYGNEAKEGVLYECQNVNAGNIVEVLHKFPVPYSYLRTQVKPIPEEVKPAIAKYMSLDHLIWYYEELSCPEVNIVLLNRLKAGETPKFGYGKLMERLLYFRSIEAPFVDYLLPIAEDRLRSIQLYLESPVVVCGDASYSMDVAIRCSTIIGSVLSCLTNAELLFFNDKVIKPKVIPRNINQVLETTRTIKADGMTAPACLLWPLIQERKPIKFLVVVTDEVENVKSRDQYFPNLYARYVKEIAPECTIVMVSFLENPSFKGRMVTALENLGITKLIQFRLDGTRPDLTKLDALLGLLATESEKQFPKQVEALMNVMEKGGLNDLINRLQTPILESQQQQKKSQSTSSSTAPIPPTNTNTNTQQQQQQTKTKVSNKPPSLPNEQQHSVCAICMEKQSDTVLLECGHLCCCADCSDALEQCPICRSSIVRKVRIFRS